MTPETPTVLSIAGSDPSGGAGIQADLKTFSALGAFGTTVITALTAQNTQAVTGVLAVPSDFVARQIDTLFEDVRIDALKIGMVSGADIARAIADRLRHWQPPNIVLDPVMVAKSGDRLLDEDAVATVRDELVPLATVITPNLPEAGVLLGRPAPTTIEEVTTAVHDLYQLGPRYVLLKGGHMEGGDSPDFLYDGLKVIELPAKRVATKNTHGTGCTLSAAIAALLPQYPSAVDAIHAAKGYLTAALEAADTLTIGSGHGPVHHFHAWWPRGREREEAAQ